MQYEHVCAPPNCTLYPWMQTAVPSLLLDSVIGTEHITESKQTQDPNYRPESFFQRICDTLNSINMARGPISQTSYFALPTKETFTMCKEATERKCMEDFQHGMPKAMSLYYIRGSQAYSRPLYKRQNGAMFELWGEQDPDMPEQQKWVDCVHEQFTQVARERANWSTALHGTFNKSPDIDQCGTDYAPRSKGWTHNLENKCLVKGAVGKECRNMWHGCASRAVITLNRCSSCCCREVMHLWTHKVLTCLTRFVLQGLVTAGVSHTLFWGSQQQCGAWFTSGDVMLRVYMAAYRAGAIISNFRNACLKRTSRFAKGENSDAWKHRCANK